MSGIEIAMLQPWSPEIAICAGWRVAAFGDALGCSIAEEQASLEAFVSRPSEGAALVARIDGALAGSCLLVPAEIDALHHVTPWLAGLYVTPVHRRRGVGAALVEAVATEAHRRRHARLHLYTTAAAAFYERLGWRVADQFNWKGAHTVLMIRDVAAARA